ncbi:hypothetical protein T05_3082 [Trichinella murrelli]|uniref:Uncharacterized protein n=1 Tax=Trichinella murrelli TaxID=144512 RepID=A0A0V0SSC1_9BILA|nr:hypothetical protein T05_3082 [Trichinella murrelli]
MSGSSYCPSFSFPNGALGYPVPRPKGAYAPNRVLRLTQPTRLVAR